MDPGSAWLTPGMTAQSPGRTGQTIVQVSSAAELAGLTAEFDLTGLGTAVTVTPPGGCTTAGKKVTCPVLDAPGGAADGTVELVYRAGPGAAAVAGTTLSVPVRVAGPNATTATTTAKVRVINGADPIPTAPQVQLQGRSRTPVPMPVSFTNWGNRPLDGFWVRVNGENAWTRGAPPSAGCELVSAGEPPSVRCRVDSRVEVGARYAGPPVSIPMNPTVGDVDFTLWAEPLKEPEPDFGYFYTATDVKVHLTSSIPTDIAVEGATVSGEPGSTVRFAVTVRNAGPADLPLSGYGGALVSLRVEAPPGTSRTIYPPGCTGSGPVLFLCRIEGLAAGASVALTFGVTVNTKIPDATGRIDYEVAEPWDFADPNPANNRATVVVNPVPHLPVTGQRIGWIAAGGVATVVAGAALLLWARRRRTVMLVAGEDEVA
jgi:LPXTG-motif cell wall-anchored protein